MVQSIQRAVDLIRKTGEGPVTLTDAAQVLDVHKSTALRILQTLESSRFVRKLPDGSYVLGTGLVELADLALAAMDVRRLATPHIRALQELTGHTVHLAELMGDEIVYTYKEEGDELDGLQLPSRVGRAVLLHASAVGKTILAYLPKPERDRLLATQPLTRFTETTITEPAALEAEFESIRTRGWTADDAEHRPYVVCVAVPIRDARGAVRAALSVTAVKLVATLDDLEAHVPLLLDASAAISADLGHDAHTATA